MSDAKISEAAREAAAEVFSELNDVAKRGTYVQAAIDEATAPLVAALEAVLLFHSGSPWDAVKRQKWDAICGELVPKAHNDYGLYDRGPGFEATTKMLCDVVRAAIAHRDRTKGESP